MHEDAPDASGGERGSALDVEQIFERIDAATADFRAATGLECPPMCGSCCNSPEVSTTAEELAPLASELVRRGEAAARLEQLARPSTGPRCVLYAPEPDDPARGRCTMYSWRPAICRLFGFSARRDKHGKPELIGCAVHRERVPQALQRALEHVAAGLPAPMMSDHARQVAFLHPGGGAEELPINAALARALRSAALRAQLAAQADADADAEDDAEDPGDAEPAQAG